MIRGFGSDNHSGVHPTIMDALLRANQGHAPSYGTDEVSERAQKVIRSHFGDKAQAYFVFNGTAANVVSLRALTRPYQTVFASDVSHLHQDECGAPEFFTGCKLWVLPHHQGKIILDDLQKNFVRRGDQHFAQASALSLTQPTELGSVYSLDELKKLIDWAHKNNLKVHMDGARLANACIHLDCNFRDLTTDLGVDVISFGGTKNGLMMGEAVIFLNEGLDKDFSYIRKQSGQLPSKTRFIAAQFEAYFSNSLWKEIASHSTSMAKYLEQGLKECRGIEITQPVQSNAVFVKIPKDWISPLRKVSFFYVWDENTFECRLMTSWDTKKDEIHAFLEKIKELNR